MNDNFSAHPEPSSKDPLELLGDAQDRAMMLHCGLTALAQLLTGQLPGATLQAEPLAALVTILADSGEPPHVRT